MLDDTLRRAAVETGARFLPRVKAFAPLEGRGGIAGARFRRCRGGCPLNVGARLGLMNLLPRRAREGRFVRRQLEAIFAESAYPNSLFSAPGLLRALVT